MKRYFVAFLLLLTFVFRAAAEEGMLIPSLISAFESDMQAMGMKLSAGDIYSVNHSSMKDAIVQFGGGCTAELVSEKGLLLTNHHCGYSSIQSHSSLENDYLKNGFWAKNLSEELPNPGLTAMRVVRIEDVTEQIRFGVDNSMTEEERQKKLRQNLATLIEDATRGNHYEADIKAFNYGNDYYMIVKETFRDIRLVGTPPNAIGKFGGDTDNWVWPRHTGDFSVFRIYSGTDNKPADYSETNVPYKPLHFLPISFKDRKEGDFTMVYGFPGTTEQHVVSDYLKYIIEKERPARIHMRDLSLAVIDNAMRNSDEIRIKYAAKQAGIANAWKKWIGQIDGLKRMDAVSVKKEYEQNYTETARSKDGWHQYETLVDEMNALSNAGNSSDFLYAMGVEYFYVGPEYYSLARTVEKYMDQAAASPEQADSLKAILLRAGENFFKNYDQNVDQQIFTALTEEYLKQIATVKTDIVRPEYDAEKIYMSSFLTDPLRYSKFISDHFGKKKLAKALQKDPGFAFFDEIRKNFDQDVIAKTRDFRVAMDLLLKKYVEGKYVMFPDAKHWPDANSTMRITYGKLEGSYPRDGVKYVEHTTTDGIINKYNTGNPDFELLPDMVALYESKDFGRYAQDGELWVCFTGSNHTTGGNSGSPVIDANGNLMGLNFDRSWESTMSDFMFDASRCRNITVDIRYVLWVMDKYAGAKHLVDEMVLVTD